MPDSENKQSGYVLSVEQVVKIMSAIERIPDIFRSLENLNKTLIKNSESNAAEISKTNARVAELGIRVTLIEEANKKAGVLPDNKKGEVTENDILRYASSAIAVIGVLASIVYFVITGGQK